MIDKSDEKLLKSYGFIDEEIWGGSIVSSDKSLSGNRGFNIEAEAWQRVLIDRKTWYNRLAKLGYNKIQIEAEILNYYQRSKMRSPWDFIKSVYKPSKRLDYIRAARIRAQKRTNHMYNGSN